MDNLKAVRISFVESQAIGGLSKLCGYVIASAATGKGKPERQSDSGYGV